MSTSLPARDLPVPAAGRSRLHPAALPTQEASYSPSAPSSLKLVFSGSRWATAATGSSTAPTRSDVMSWIAVRRIVVAPSPER